MAVVIILQYPTGSSSAYLLLWSGLDWVALGQGLMQEQGRVCLTGLVGLPDHKAEQPDCPVPRFQVFFREGGGGAVTSDTSPWDCCRGVHFSHMWSARSRDAFSCQFPHRLKTSLKPCPHPLKSVLEDIKTRAHVAMATSIDIERRLIVLCALAHSCMAPPLLFNL